MMSFRRLRPLLLMVTLASLARAEDIDLFKGGGPQDPSPPNVLIYLDNTSNWSANNQAWKRNEVYTKCGDDSVCQGYVSQIFGSESSLTQGEVEVAALKLVLNELVCSSSTPIKMSVGLMMIKPSKGTYTNNEGTSTNPSGIGGLLRRAVLPLESNRCETLLADLDEILTQISNPAWKAPNDANYGGALFDAFKYYGGYTNPAGASAGSAGSPAGHIGFGPERYGTASTLEEPLAFTESGEPFLTYQSPITTAAGNLCGGKNFILLVGNGFPKADEVTRLTSLGYAWDATQFPFAGSGVIPDVWARFMATTDVSPVAGQQTVQTYTMNIFNASEDADQTALLQSMARNGNGSYYEIDGSLAGLIDSFRNFFTSINAANQAFAPSTLPPSSGSGFQLNQVYMGMFRPDKNPRWFGNLKLFQFAVTGFSTDPITQEETPIIKLVDSNQLPIQGDAEGTTGFIVDNAVSFWTQPSDFWTYRCGVGSSFGDPLLCGNPLSPSDSPDGAVVEKGGARQRLKEAFTIDLSNSSRQIYTGSGASELFTTANGAISQTLLGAATSSERTELINWVRGVDNIGENTLVKNGARPSIAPDVLHSTPVAVNYGTNSGGCSATDQGDIVVFYAGNDGLLHALQGGTNNGQELWSYIPSEFWGDLKRLRDNSPPVTFPAPVPAGANNKPYLIDGNLSVHAPDANNDCKPDKVWLFLTLRRGGRFIYALDITNKSAPSLLWKKGAVDLPVLGQSWSTLKPILLANGKPALIFGAGYDPNAEDRPYDTETGTYGTPTSSVRTMGQAVLLLDAETGTLLKQLPAGSYSLPSEVAVVSDFSTGIAQVAYVGDTGANLWKVSLLEGGHPTADPTQWTISQFASLGDPSDLAKTGPNARTFLYPPDIVKTDGGYALLIGSGDRTKPFETTVRNRFYMLRDVGTGGIIRCEGSEASCDLFDATHLPADPNSVAGWRIDLAAGEKTVGSAITLNGLTYFPTNTPPSPTGSECNLSLGTARMYSIRYETAEPYIPSAGRAEIIPGGGFPPSPSSSTVRLTYPGSDGTEVTETVSIVHSGSTVVTGQTLPSTRRIYCQFREGVD